jgi:hypothetical protein
MKRISFIAALCAAALCGCGSDPAPSETKVAPGSTLWVVNASRAAIDVTVDGVPSTSGLGIAGVALQGVTPGAHTLHLQTPGSTCNSPSFTTPCFDMTFTATLGAAVTAVAQSSIEGALIADTLSDTGSVAVDGKSKLRVVHIAGTAPAVDIWRTQPDYQTPIRVMFPFAYGAQSPYLQSDPGTWTVYVTSTSDWNTKLAESGPITVASGEVKTVVLLDSAGVLKLRALSDR